MRARVLAQNLAQRPWIDTSTSLAGQPLRTHSHSWPVRPVEVSIAISGRSFCGRHNAHQGDRTPNPPAAGRVSGVTGHEGLGYIKFTKKIKRCQKKWPFKRGGRPRGGRWWGVLLYSHLQVKFSAFQWLVGSGESSRRQQQGETAAQDWTSNLIACKVRDEY